MILTRRALVGIGGGFAAGLLTRPLSAGAAESVDIGMHGNANGSRVGFDPLGLHIAPGTAVRWVNLDAGNAHTATAYHPDIMDRPRRMPEGAEPWDSDYLLPEETFSVTLTVPGVYDYYCVPHEHAGMVGRIVVGEASEAWRGYAAEIGTGTPLPEAALDGFPTVADIVRLGAIAGS